MFFDAIISTSKDKCCGCDACVQICTQKAISMVADDEGFLYPVLQLDRCIDCGICEHVCPIINHEKAKSNEDPLAFAAIIKNEDELLKSSSGGIFTAIANYVLNQGGIVYGAAFDEYFKLRHEGIDNVDSLNKLRGSKYIQSNNQGIYSQIKDKLCEGRLVYYVGTGCQVAGLKLFLKKKYDNLITSDLVCHGVPSQSAFDAAISKFQYMRNVVVETYSFRDKKVLGWSCSSSSYSKHLISGKVKYYGFDPILRSYFNAFISASNFREICYKCPFATVERCGDITLADYWGVKKYHPNILTMNGVSAIFVNSDKGKAILNNIKDSVTLFKSKKEWIVDGNLSMRAPMHRPKVRDVFYKELKANPIKLYSMFENDTKIRKIKFKLIALLKTNRDIYLLLWKLKHKVWK